jgi:hypothetical protein
MAPRLVAKIAVMLSGLGAASAARRRKSGSASCTAGLNRRSKPMVELGRPHMPLPHAPSKWAGKTST